MGLQNAASNFDWGWQISPDHGSKTVGHYYVKLPQSEQRVVYAADESGYHGAVALNTSSDHHTSSSHFALGQRALELGTSQIFPPHFQNFYIQKPAEQRSDPIEIYLLQKQHPQPEPVLFRSNYVNLPHYNNLQPFYNLLNQGRTKTNHESSLPLLKEVKSEQTYDSPVVVFKDVKCNSNHSDHQTDVGVKHKKHNFKLVTPRPNSRNERFYFKQILTTTEANKNDGIKKLIHSTKDLITNDDLLRINNAAEYNHNFRDDDLIKPRPRYSFRTELGNHETLRTAPSQLTVQAKIPKIENTNIEFENDELNNSNFNLNSPIIVADPNDNYETTMRTKNDYKVVGLKNEGFENDYVTTSQINENYLKPITVGVRLLNSIESNLDHEAADSEISEITNKDNTIVEIQKAIPLSITHINDVETHEYLDFDNNKPLAKPLIKQKQNNHKDNEVNSINKKEPLQLSDSQQNTVTVAPDSFGQKRSENINFFINNHHNGFDYEDSHKVIQPIVIEKQVKEKYVEKCKEKEVSRPEPIAVPVPIDRPIAVPIEKIVEKPVEVTKYVDKPFRVDIHHPYPVEVKVPYPIEQKVYVDRPVHVPYPVEKLIKKTVVQPVIVPTPVAVPFPVEKKVLYPIAYEKQVPVPIEKPIEKIVHKEIPVPYPVEKRVPIHYETKVPVPYPVEKRVPVIHPVPVPIHIHHPYPVDRIVEKKVPYPVHIEKIVEKEVPVPYPVEKVVEKTIETPHLATKYIDKYHDKRQYHNENIEKPVPYPVRYDVKVHSQKPCDLPCVIYRNEQAHLHETKNHPQYLYEPRNQHQREETRNVHLQRDETRNLPQYNPFNYQEVQHNPTFKDDINKSIHNIQWNNQYATSYQYINTTHPKPKDGKQLTNDFLYISNLPNYSGLNHEKKKHFEEKYESNRMPRVLKLEYGFKPPLIPSIQVDLDGLPVNTGFNK